MIEESICHGHFTMADESGNIVVDSNNMIVASGRKYIMHNGFPESGLQVFLSEDNAMTEADFNYDKIKDNIVKNVSLVSGNPSEQDDCYKFDDDNICVVIAASYKVDDNESTKKISSAGLIFEIDSGTTLFSRLSFETKYLKAGSTYKINYTIQF